MVLTVHGLLAAIQVSAQRVVLASVDTGLMVGELSLGRDIVGMSGGPRGALWIGLRHGDVQRVGLLLGERAVGGSHEGRAQVPWPIEVKVDAARLRGMLARHQAGGAALSEYVPPPEPTSSVKWTAWRVAGLVLAGVLTAVATWWLLHRMGWI
jgi:hypothetical protein